MQVCLTNLSNELYTNSRLLLNDSAKEFGISLINSFNFNEIKATDFYNKNKEILDEAVGLGFWLWKPYIILRSFESLSEGDIVIYADSGIRIIDSLQPLIEICNSKEPILLFGNGNFTNNRWTKRDCFVFMNCDAVEYWLAPHCDAAFCMFRKCEQSISFLREWLSYCSNKYILTDLPNISGKVNFPEYIEHRRDQSVLSILAQKHKISLYRMPTQYGNHYKVHEVRVSGEFNCINQSDQKQVHYYSVIPYYNSLFGQLLNHHRTRNIIDCHVQEEAKQNSSYDNRSIKLKSKTTVVKSIIQKSLRQFGYQIIRKTVSEQNHRVSYSQCGEDLLIDYVFRLRGIEKPTYIDIGANDPFYLNNTALFYYKGCRGINIEANPVLFDKFKEHRSGDINLNIGIGPKDDYMDFFIVDDSTLSSFSKEEVQKVTETGKYSVERVEKIRLTTIENILNEHWHGKFPDFMSLDVEGLDFEILKSIDFQKHSPKLICVEAAEYSPIGAGAKRVDLINFLISKGYYEYASTNLNSIMVKEDFWFV